MTGLTRWAPRHKLIMVAFWRRLVHSWRRLYESRRRRAAQGELGAGAWGKFARITVCHSQFARQTTEFCNAATGCPVVLSGLKTIAETAKPLGYPR